MLEVISALYERISLIVTTNKTTGSRTGNDHVGRTTPPSCFSPARQAALWPILAGEKNRTPVVTSG
jgi:hypothetical protein